MARTVTLLELRTWARQLSGTENNPNIADSELTALANRHLCEVYDRLVDAGPPDYYASEDEITVAIGSTGEPCAADFRNLLDVYVHEGTVERRRIQPMPHGARGRYQLPTAAATVTVEYIPTPLDLVDDGDTFDGVSGWEELIANLMARDVMIKRKDDPAAVMATIGRLEMRITSRSRNRDRGNPKRVTDLDEQNSVCFNEVASAKITAYRLRGGNIEFFEPLTRWP